jgi:succinate dehydrogenase / fumarate reductase cytochrome b subunit
MNLVLVFSLDAYDQVTQFLGANWYAVVASLILAAGFIVHILYASILTLQNQKARGKDKYAVKNTKDASWSSKNMYVLGFVVLSFLVLHMIQFWYEMQFKELFGMEGAINRGSELIVPLFKQPLYVIVYLIAFVALWLHLTHGFWSALHTVGWNNTIWMKRLKNISYVVATIIVAGFTVIPIYVYFFVPSPF